MQPEIRQKDTRDGRVVFYIRHPGACGWRPIKAKEANRMLEEGKAAYNPKAL